MGATGISVSRLCFGMLTLSPLQCKLDIDDAERLLIHAIDRGINFFDTAQLYQTYDSLKRAVKYKNDIVISTKDYCYDRRTAQRSIDNALKSIGRDYIDFFLLHEMESKHTIRGHWEAVEYLIERKQAGDIRAVGLSTHYIAAVRAALQYPQIEVIHPLYNSAGLGIADGSAAQMISEVKSAHQSRRGLYAMKILGGGHLTGSAKAEIQTVLSENCFDAIAIGMKSMDEVDYNVAVFDGASINDELGKRLSRQKRNLLIHDWCIGCGNCVNKCSHGALRIVEGKARVNDQCVLCGYCASVCRDFCIKVV